MNWQAIVLEALSASLLRPVFLVLAAIVLLRLFRVDHPASRHAVWAGVLAGMLVLPFANLTFPHIDIPVAPPETPTLARPEAPASIPDEASAPLRTASGEFEGMRGGVTLNQRPTPPEAGAASPARPRQPLSPASLVLWIYLSGLLAILGYRFTGWILLQRLLSRTIAVGRTLLSESAEVDVPVTVGLLRPRVILPKEWRRWDPGIRRAVLAHEFAHLRSRDLWVMALARTVRHLFWFHPLAWWASRKAAETAEMACDRVAMRKVATPSAYSKILVDFAGRVSRRRFRIAIPDLAMARSTRLSRRIDMVFASGITRSPRLPLWTVATVGTPLVLLSATLGLSRPAPLRVIPPVVTAEPEIEAREPEVPIAATLQEAAQPIVPPQNPIADLIEQGYCLRCHYSSTSTRAPARLVLDDLEVNDIARDAPIWERVVTELRARSMPPAGYARPEPDVYDSALQRLEDELDAVEAARVADGKAIPVSDLELAARLTRFLSWGEPDAELRRLAENGTLSDPGVLEGQARRLMADNDSPDVIREYFFRDWLGLWMLDDEDGPLISDFRAETREFLRSQLREDHSLLDLLTADYTFVNESLAEHYGIPEVEGTELRRVTLEDERRRGVLGQASVLTAWSRSGRISPTTRGIMVLKSFLGLDVGDPPPNIGPIPEVAPGQSTSVRRRLEEVTADDRCQGCHWSIDGLGFGLQNFDATGRWQDRDGDAPADASGGFPDGTEFDGIIEFREGLLDRQDAFLHTLTGQLLGYALGGPIPRGLPRRQLRYDEMPAVRAIVREAAEDDYRWSAIITGIVRSTPFRTTRIDRDECDDIRWRRNTGQC